MQDDAQHKYETADFFRSTSCSEDALWPNFQHVPAMLTGSCTGALSTMVPRDSRSQRVVMICVHSLKRRRPWGSFAAKSLQRGTGILQAGSATAASCEDEKQEDEDEVCQYVMLGWCCIVEGRCCHEAEDFAEDLAAFLQEAAYG